MPFCLGSSVQMLTYYFQDDFDITKSDNATTYASLSRACIGKFAKPYFKDEEGYVCRYRLQWDHFH